MYGANNLSIGISLILRDQFSGRMANARKELDLTTAAGKRAEKQSVESQRNMNAAGAVAGVTALASMREWVKVGANFDKQMTYTYSIVDKKSGETLRGLKDKAMAVGQETMFSSTEVAGAMTTMAQAGQDYDQILGNIKSTAILAAATMSGIEQSSSAMNDIMIGFDIGATEKNSMKVADIITRTINDSNIALDSYAETMKYVIPTARTLGVTLEEVSAITSVLGNAGLKGSMAGTGTENMIRLLAIAAGKEEGTKEYGALARMGLSPKDLTDAQGNLRPIQEIMQLLGQGMMNLPNVERTKVITDLLNIRGGRPGQLLTFAEGLVNFGKALKGINESGGTAQRTANDVIVTLSGGMERISSAWETFEIAFTEAIEPVLVPALEILTALLKGIVGIMNTPAGKLITVLVSGFLLIRTGAMIYRTILLSLQLLHLRTGATAVSGTGRAAAGYNMLTNSINQTTTAVQRLNMAQQVSGMGRATYSQGRKQWTANNWGIGRDTAVMQRYYQRYGMAGKLSQLGGVLGKASPYAAIGGLALTAGAGMMKEGSGGQKAMELGGSALSGAGTGAMLGSMIMPGVGTAVGAVVGGVGSIMWTLYDQTQREKEKLKAAEAEAKSMEGKSVSFEAHDWAKRAKAILTMRSQAYAFAGNYERNPENMRAYQEHYTDGSSLFGKGQKIENKNNITVNIDGAKAFNKMIDQNNYTANVQFSF